MKLCLVRVFCSVIHKILVLIVKKKLVYPSREWNCHVSCRAETDFEIRIGIVFKAY